MKTGISEALLLSLIMGAVIFFCRVFPFLFFRNSGENAGRRKNAVLGFVEKTVPPLAMTVLTFNALASPIFENIRNGVPVLAAAGFTVIVHLWRRNPLISIFGGTAIFMVLERLMGM